MKRRDFLKKTINAGVIGSSALAFNPLKAYSATGNHSTYDMIAIRGGSPEAMFDRAITEFGGMGRIVGQGQTVVVKPNIGWDTSPERAANTNPELIGRIIRHCLAAGAKDVYVFDHTCNEWSKCYQNSGIEYAVKKAGGKMVMGNSEKYYQDVDVKSSVILRNVKVHELVLESDVFINVPILKNHGGANMTISMKNLMGIVWDRGYWHRNDLHQCIADFAGWRNPDLTIVDAYRVMKRNGPRGVSVEDVVSMQAQLIGKDMVALDTAAIKLFGKDPAEVKYVGLAETSGVGSGKLEEMNIARIKL